MLNFNNGLPVPLGWVLNNVDCRRLVKKGWMIKAEDGKNIRAVPSKKDKGKISKAAGLFANAQFNFKRAFFPKTTHSEDAEPDNLSMLVYSLHQRIMCRFAHEPRSITEPYL